MHQADRERPKKLIEPQLLQHPLQEVARLPIGVHSGVHSGTQMHVDLRAVTVDVFVNDALVLMKMRVHNSVVIVVWSIAMGNSLRNTGQIEDAEQDEHQADGQLHGETDARRNDDVEENDGRAHAEDGDGVADAPERSDHTCLADAPLAADDGGNGDDVVRVCGMAHAKDKSQTDHCQYIYHATRLYSPDRQA